MTAVAAAPPLTVGRDLHDLIYVPPAKKLNLPAETVGDRDNCQVARMPIPLAAPEVLEREFLESRARVLQVAASLDRVARAEGNVGGDKRLLQIAKALEILAGGGSDRAE